MALTLTLNFYHSRAAERKEYVQTRRGEKGERAVALT